MLALTEILAQELAPEIRVNAIAPGAILPPAGASRDYMQRLADQVPLRRSGSVDDITSAVLYLLRADFVTGEVLAVTGGEHLLKLRARSVFKNAIRSPLSGGGSSEYRPADFAAWPACSLIASSTWLPGRRAGREPNRPRPRRAASAIRSAAARPLR